MIQLTQKRVLVTGGAGFLGRFVVEQLARRGCKDVYIARSKDYNLVDIEAVRRLYREAQPQIVLHLAARVGGIGAIAEKAGEFFYENLMMGAQMMEEGRLFGVEKFVVVGTACAYPRETPVPFSEDDFWNGYPEKTNASYALAKKVLLVQAASYRQQYGYNAIYLIPVNLYGPWDNFAPERSHVVPALIKKCVDAIEAGQREILAWGTGKATRECLYVADCADGIVLATEKYDKGAPVNLGSGVEISIKSLVEMIAGLTGFTGAITWDATRPDGQPRRLLDSSRAESEFGFRARTSLEQGLITTIQWYRDQRARGLVP